MNLVANYQGTEYESGINYEDCKCICHQELKYEGKTEEGLDKLVKYRYRDNVLTFDEKGQFISCEYSEQPSTSTNSTNNNDTKPSSNTGCMVTLLLMVTGLLSLVSLFFIVV